MSRMRRLFLFFFLIIMLGGVEKPARAQDCPKDTTGQSLNDWRDKLITKVLAKNYQETLTNLENCFPKNIPACYGDLKYYADLKQNPNDYPDNFNLKQEELTIKSESELPSIFLPKDSEGKVIPGGVIIPGNILEEAKKNNWPTALYKTRSTGGFDGRQNLFMVAVTTPDMDIFFQTSPQDDDHGNLNPLPKPSNGDFTKTNGALTIITVDKKQKPPVGQLRKIYAYGSPDASGRVPYTWSNQTEDPRDCMNCHTGPLRPISPIGYKNVNKDEEKMDPVQEQQVDALNSYLEQTVSWQKTTMNGKVIKSGPPVDNYPLGWAPPDSKTRQEDFLKTCATSQTSQYYSGRGGYSVNINQGNPAKINYEKLAEAMNCVACHNNERRGILHEGFSSSELKFKILVDRSMPRGGVDLNDDERLALYSCLFAEREAVKDEWRKSGDWLRRASCYGDQFDGKKVVIPQNKKGSKSNTENSVNQN